MLEVISCFLEKDQVGSISHTVSQEISKWIKKFNV